MIHIYFTVSLIYYYTALGIARDADKNVDGAEDEMEMEMERRQIVVEMVPMITM